MKPILLENVTIADPQSPFDGKQVYLLIREAHIAAINPDPISLANESVERITAEGLFVSPGWMDMHVQLSDPGYEWKETLPQMATAAVKGGFTSVLAYPNTHPVIDNRHLVESIQLRTKDLPIEVLLSGTISENGAGKELAEMYDMARAGAVAFTDGNHPLQNGGLMMRALQYNQAFGGLLIQYPTDDHLVGAGQMHEGVVSANLGMKGIPSIAESLGTARDLRIQQYTGGKVHFQPITTAASLQELIVAAQNDPQITLGTNISYLALQDADLTDFDPNYKVMPPFRSENEITPLIEAIRNGQVHTLSSGHAAQSTEEKKLQFEQAEPGILGLQTAFSLAYELLVQPGHIDLGQLISLLSYHPRKILGKPSITIEEGAVAELSLFQPEASWTFTKADIPSRAKNSPFLDRTFQSKVLGIIRAGSFYRAY